MYSPNRDPRGEHGYSPDRDPRGEPGYFPDRDPRGEPRYSPDREPRGEPSYSSDRDSRAEHRYSPHRNPRGDTRYPTDGDPREEPRYAPDRDPRGEPRYSPDRDPRGEPRYSPDREPREEPRYSRDRDNRGEPMYPSGRDPRAEYSPDRDPRAEPRYSPDRDPRAEPRYSPDRDPRQEPRYSPERDPRGDTRYPPDRDPREEPRYSPDRDPRGGSMYPQDRDHGVEPRYSPRTYPSEDFRGRPHEGVYHGNDPQDRNFRAPETRHGAYGADHGRYGPTDPYVPEYEADYDPRRDPRDRDYRGMYPERDQPIGRDDADRYPTTDSHGRSKQGLHRTDDSRPGYGDQVAHGIGAAAVAGEVVDVIEPDYPDHESPRGISKQVFVNKAFEGEKDGMRNVQPGGATGTEATKVVLSDGEETGPMSHEEEREARGLELRRRRMEEDLAHATGARKLRLLATMKRSELQAQQTTKLTGFKQWKHQRAKTWQHTKREANEMFGYLEMWRGSFKTIEGKFGTSVGSYFRFVKILFFINLLISLAHLLVILMPQLILKPATFEESVPNATQNSNQETAVQCSKDYKQWLRDSTNNTASQAVLGFFQGTGWMEDQVTFYGYYFNKTIFAPVLSDSRYIFNMPLAYLLVTVCCFFLSLVFMVQRSAQGLKENLVQSGNKFNRACNKVFSGWDYSMSDEQAAKHKRANLKQELLSIKYEMEREKKFEHMTDGQKARLYLIRTIINLMVIAVWGASFYLIYYINGQAALWGSQTTNEFELLLIQYLPSVTITVLNIIVPIIFQKVVTLEDYSPDGEIQITIFRTVLLRLASLFFLLLSLANQVAGCDDAKRTCGICNEYRGVFRCWETYIGQQIYKLVLLNFLVTVAITFFVEFPRKLVVSHFRGRALCDLVGEQEFEVPKNVLDIVYTQTLCWLGAFFSPLIPAMTLVKFFIFFYMKKLSLLKNCVQPVRPYRTSSSNSFFMIILLISFVIICVIPVGYCIGNIRPSIGCGPFRVYSSTDFTMYRVIVDLVRSWPVPVPDIYFTVGSWIVYLILIPLLILIIIYYIARISSTKKLAELLRDQLALEGKDKQYLLKQVNEALVRGDLSNPAK